MYSKQNIMTSECCRRDLFKFSRYFGKYFTSCRFGFYLAFMIAKCIHL